MVVAAVVALRVYAVQQKLVLWPAGDVAFMPSFSMSSPVLCVDYALHTTTADCGMPDLDSSSGWCLGEEEQRRLVVSLRFFAALLKA